MFITTCVSKIVRNTVWLGTFGDATAGEHLLISGDRVLLDGDTSGKQFTVQLIGLKPGSFVALRTPLPTISPYRLAQSHTTSSISYMHITTETAVYELSRR